MRSMRSSAAAVLIATATVAASLMAGTSAHAAWPLSASNFNFDQKPTQAQLAALRDLLLQEMGSLPSGRIHDVLVVDGKDRLYVEYSAGDPSDYREWVTSVGDRFGFWTARRYVPRDGRDATEAELTAVKQELISSWMSLKVRPSGGISLDLDNAAVLIECSGEITPEFRVWLDSAQSTYGNRVRVQVDANGGSLTSGSTAGGYGIVGKQDSGYFGAPIPCTLGFNMIKNGEYHLVTASHCTWGNTEFDDASAYRFWYIDRFDGIPHEVDYLGYRSGSQVLPPDGDMAAIKYSPMAAGITKYGTVYHYTSSHQDITEIGVAEDQVWVCASGVSTHERCQFVTDTCAAFSVNDPKYGQIDFNCLIRVPIRTDFGDSGGPLWRFSAGLDIQSGGYTLSNNYPNGPSYFDRLLHAASQWGLQAY